MLLDDGVNILKNGLLYLWKRYLMPVLICIQYFDLIVQNVMVRAVNFSAAKKFEVHLWQRNAKLWRIYGRNYCNLEDLNSSFICKAKMPFSLSVTN